MVGALMLVVVVTWPTTRVPFAVLPRKLTWAAYVAERAWPAALGAVIVKVAVPLVSSSGVNATPSTLNDTLPVGVTPEATTLTVTIPLAPYAIAGALMLVVVVALFTVRVPDVGPLAWKLPEAA